MSGADIVDDFLRTIKKYDPRFRRWTVGITNDMQRRTNEHGVAWAFYNRASSVNVARDVEMIMLGYGCQGGPGGGHDGTVCVYLIHDSARL